MKNLISWRSTAFFLLIVGFLAAITYLTPANAGNLTPPGSPAATFYTLEDIYTRLTTNATASEGDHSFSPGASPAGSMRTFTEIYDTIPTIVANTVKLGTSYLGVNGTLTPDGGTAVAADVLSGKTVHLTDDWTLDTGTMTDREGDNASSAQAAASGVNYFTAPSGFYDGDDRVSATDAEVAALDGDIAAGNILSGTTIFGVDGSASSGVDLSSMFNGSNTGGSIPGGSQADGGVDDYNNGGSAPEDRYEGTWTACDPGNNYCGTGLSTADAKDDSTGLVWSLPCNGSGCSSFSDSSPITYSWDDSGGNNNSQTASQLCSAGSHGQSGWSLPHQKQFMQAYVDGSYGNLEASGVSRTYWSATARSSFTSFAYYSVLSNGYTIYAGKTGSHYVRCVRLAS